MAECMQKSNAETTSQRSLIDNYYSSPPAPELAIPCLRKAAVDMRILSTKPVQISRLLAVSASAGVSRGRQASELFAGR